MPLFFVSVKTYCCWLRYTDIIAMGVLQKNKPVFGCVFVDYVDLCFIYIIEKMFSEVLKLSTMHSTEVLATTLG